MLDWFQKQQTIVSCGINFAMTSSDQREQDKGDYSLIVSSLTVSAAGRVE